MLYQSASVKTLNALKDHGGDDEKIGRRCPRPKVYSFKFAMFCTTAVYLTIGVMGFCYIFEQWSITDCIYFSVVTFSTVGYGDMSSTTDGGKLFNCAFVLMGHTILGIILGYIGLQMYMNKVEKLRKEQFGTASLDSPLSRGFSNSVVSDVSGSVWRENFFSKISKKISGIFNSFRTQLSGQSSSSTSSPEEKTTCGILKLITIRLLPIAIAFGLGAAVVRYMEEDWTWIDSLYWVTMTGTTVGYGDYSPKKFDSRLFSIFFIPVCVTLITIAIGKIATFFIDKEIEKFNAKLLRRDITLQDLEAMNTDGDGEVGKLEFIQYFLVTMKKVEPELLDQLHAQFQNLDEDGSGGLEIADLLLRKSRELSRQRVDIDGLNAGNAFPIPAVDVVHGGKTVRFEEGLQGKEERIKNFDSDRLHCEKMEEGKVS